MNENTKVKFIKAYNTANISIPAGTIGMIDSDNYLVVYVNETKIYILKKCVLDYIKIVKEFEYKKGDFVKITTNAGKYIAIFNSIKNNMLRANFAIHIDVKGIYSISKLTSFNMNLCNIDTQLVDICKASDKEIDMFYDFITSKGFIYYNDTHTVISNKTHEDIIKCYTAVTNEPLLEDNYSNVELVSEIIANFIVEHNLK